MSLEAAILTLADAVNRLAGSATGAAPSGTPTATAPAADAPKRGRGRPPKAAEVAPPPAEPEAEVVEEVIGEAIDGAAEAPIVTKDECTKAAMALVKVFKGSPKGKEALLAVLKDFGSVSVSGVDSERYSELLEALTTRTELEQAAL